MDPMQLERLIEAGNKEEINILLSQNRALATAHTSQGVSPVMLASYYKKPEIAQMIAEYVPQLSIFEASALGDMAQVISLVDKDPAMINKFSDDGFTPLGIACYFGQDDIAAFLLANGAEANVPANNGFNVYPIHSAAAANNPNISKMLLEAGADPNVKQMAGVTPLHSAAEHGNITLIINLLEHGADTSVRMEGGKLPADLAAEKGHKEIADILTG